MLTTAERLGALADLDDAPEDEWTPGPGVTAILPCERCHNPRRLKQATCGGWWCAWCWDHAALDPYAGLSTVGAV